MMLTIEGTTNACVVRVVKDALGNFCLAILT